ncbi:Protein RD3-like [Trichoplax sp. H2]|uniref:Protein RD3-like n=1 Tax=Trichoplax adhaerens TaxID=10228 RepID=B3RUW4_TRIAD|nr:hypothetical protein TRIADDRAFT_55437 [Trichoplax adhaerens]EDV25897.1 hypothetical protein TRIADDRAFT_55437 [Trichoplax adhaerens]RDD43817.1 Protein RD3-like [Trichoplax sp. H2]|eukprot:XP_002111930.1 hypothetical protein TRIADDRAFT_55437 [Trichoplax adhaerens]
MVTSMIRLNSFFKFNHNHQCHQSAHRRQADNVVKILLSEVVECIKEVSEATRQRQRELRQKELNADYSWLTTNSFKNDRIPDVERDELEILARKISPDETAQIILTFRDAALLETDCKQLPSIMKCTIQTYLWNKYSDESSTNQSKYCSTRDRKRAFSLQSVRPTRVAPSSSSSIDESLVETCSTSASPTNKQPTRTWRIRSLPTIRSSSSAELLP